MAAMTVASLDRIIAFIEQVGIAVRTAPLGDETFMPGVTVCDGGIAYDPGRLTHPGDLLHEAGHIAVTDPALRPGMSVVSGDPGEEMAAIAWSYAALRAIDIAPEIVFHSEGYQGGGESIIANFGAGHYFGVPLLQWYGMAARHDEDPVIPRYPALKRWLR